VGINFVIYVGDFFKAIVSIINVLRILRNAEKTLFLKNLGKIKNNIDNKNQ
jgi:hypothetical protein